MCVWGGWGGGGGGVPGHIIMTQPLLHRRFANKGLLESFKEFNDRLIGALRIYQTSLPKMMAVAVPCCVVWTEIPDAYIPEYAF